MNDNHLKIHHLQGRPSAIKFNIPPPPCRGSTTSNESAAALEFSPLVPETPVSRNGSQVPSATSSALSSRLTSLSTSSTGSDNKDCLYSNPPQPPPRLKSARPAPLFRLVNGTTEPQTTENVGSPTYLQPVNVKMNARDDTHHVYNLATNQNTGVQSIHSNIELSGRPPFSPVYGVPSRMSVMYDLVGAETPCPYGVEPKFLPSQAQDSDSLIDPKLKLKYQIVSIAFVGCGIRCLERSIDSVIGCPLSRLEAEAHLRDAGAEAGMFLFRESKGQMVVTICTANDGPYIHFKVEERGKTIQAPNFGLEQFKTFIATYSTEGILPIRLQTLLIC